MMNLPEEYIHSDIYRITDYGAVPDAGCLQTDVIQRVLDLCQEGGGTVVIPAGQYRIGGLMVHSDTTLCFEQDAWLIGSEVCEDYAVFPVPDGVEMRSDMEMITAYYRKAWPEYRRAMISVYGGKNVAIVGEGSCGIDGSDCADPKGEEGYRGPHGIFITCVENLLLQGYTARNCGNFMHETNHCKHVLMKNVTCLGGSDGVHLHCSTDMRIEDCHFETGDDCIAGINVSGLTVSGCELNTSCEIFRMGGSHILVENCRIWGPGTYPHRMTVVQNRGTELVRRKENTLPLSAGRHNLIQVWVHFSSTTYPAAEPYGDIVFRNCTVDGAGRWMQYEYCGDVLQKGATLSGMTLENVTATNLLSSSLIVPAPGEAIRFRLKNVRYTFRPGCGGELLKHGEGILLENI